MYVGRARPGTLLFRIAAEAVRAAGDCFRSFHKYPLFIRAVLYYNKTTNMKK